jgi:hypothetical protein
MVWFVNHSQRQQLQINFYFFLKQTMDTNNILALLGNVMDDGNIAAISKQIGTQDGATKKAIATALPALLQSLSKNASTPEGAEALNKTLDKHDGSVLDNISGLLSGGDAGQGGAIIQHILGSWKWEVVGKMSQKAGLSGMQSEQLLKTLAPLVMGALGKAKNSGGLQATDLVSMLSQSAGASTMFVSFLDQNGDGKLDSSDMLSAGMNFIKKKFFG